MFLSLTTGEITGIIGAAATVLTVFIVPILKMVRKRIVEKQKEAQDRQQEKIERQQQQTALTLLIEQLTDMKKDNADLHTKIDNFLTDYDEFTTQNLKYMINDAYFSYNDIHEIPDDILTNACECCEIYVNKRHKNHEIRPRCTKLWEEQERRALLREVHHGE